MADVYYINCDMTESIATLSAGGSALTAATVTYALKNAAGTTLAGGTGSYTHSSAGNYSATIDADVTGLMSAGAVYWLEVTITSSGGVDDFRRVKRVAQYRGST